MGKDDPHPCEPLLRSEDSDQPQDFPITVMSSSRDITIYCSNTCGFAEAPPTGSHECHERDTVRRKLGQAIILSLIFMAIEVVGGLMSNSLAILTDAAHLLSDVAGFAISLFSIWMAGWEASPRHSFGYHRMEILGAMMSMQLIWMITGILVYEAIQRLVSPKEDINGRLMFITAAFGVAFNVALTVLLGHEHHHHGHSHTHSHSDSHSHELEGGHSCGSDPVNGHADEHHKHEHNECQGSGSATGNSGTVHSHEEHAREHKAGFGGGEEPVEGNLGQPLNGVAVSGKGAAAATARATVGGACESRQSGTNARSTAAVSPASPHCAPKDINLQGAYLHVLGDLIQSVGVMIAGGIIWAYPEWKVIDLACTLTFSLLVLVTTLRMLRDITDVLMESTPREIDARKLEASLRALPGVADVHDLHIWAITLGKTVLACHVRAASGSLPDDVLRRVLSCCAKDYKIKHATVQVEASR